MKMTYIFCIIALIVTFIGLGTIIISPKHIEEVDCFDKEGNKIIGLVCEEELPEEEIVDILFKLEIIAIGSLVCGLFCFIFDMMNTQGL